MIFDRHHSLAVRFSYDPGVVARYYLGFTKWLLGDAAAASKLVSDAHSLAERIGHSPTIVAAFGITAFLDCVRRDPTRALANAERAVALAGEFNLPTWRMIGALSLSWARAALVATPAGWDDHRSTLAEFDAQGVGLLEIHKSYLAQGYASVGELEPALALANQALANIEARDLRVLLPEAHRVCGEILLKRDSADSAPAEDALQSALATAREQGARSFELRAALSLAKLYQSTGPPADAHAVLAPELEGLSPTPEMPEIAEAQALLAALGEADEVKAEAAQRRRMTRLQVAYGNALIAARGFGAPETTEAFARARESASGDKDAPERLAADFGLWAGSYARGELLAMRAQAAACLADVEPRPDSPETGVAHRVQGITHWFAGEFVEARDHLERALALFQPGRDDEMAFRFGPDPGVAAMAYLAFTLWPLGEVDRAVSLVERMRARIGGLTNANTLALGTVRAALFSMMRGDPSRARTNVAELGRIVREHDLPMHRAFGVFLEGWATAEAGAPAEGLEGMRRGVESLREQNVLVFDGLLKIMMSEGEARAGDLERAVATLDEALTTAERAGHRTFEAELHRVRGEILLKRDPSTPAPAEDGFLTALAVAKQQGARSFDLRAALSLAKLYQSTGRPVDAHAVLAPALEGFLPTPEMPEIAEAQALLAG